MQRKIPLLAILGATAAYGCKSAEPARHPVSGRAAADLRCPEEELSHLAVDRSTMTVEGCGRRATYVEVCQSKFNAAASATMGMPASTEDCQWDIQP